MKKVILSSDGDSVLYLVPDVVADDLEAYCLEFCSNWLCHKIICPYSLFTRANTRAKPYKSSSNDV